MGIEIERKFLVKDDLWKEFADPPVSCYQGYLSADKEKTVRVRIIGDQAYLTVKGVTTGLTRAEFEYEIPVSDAQDLLELCGDVVQKTRALVRHQGMIWEIDVFEGSNDGLVLAEVELDTEDQPIELPSWVGLEVSDDKRYYNACLAKHPFTTWS